MASYETHRNVGLWVGITIAGLLSIYSAIMVTMEGYLALYTFLACVVGAIIPDVEAGKKSKPNEIAFFILSILGALYSQQLLTSAAPIGLVQKILNVIPTEAAYFLPVGVFMLIFFGVRDVFAKVVHHRGAFHSSPAVLVAFLLMFVLLRAKSLETHLAIRYAMDFAIGYYAHLLADEINSLFPGKKRVAVDCDGECWNPKDSLGSAIDLHLPVDYRKRDGAFSFAMSDAGRWVGFIIMYVGGAALYLFVAQADLKPWIMAHSFPWLVTLGCMVLMSMLVNLIHQSDMRKTYG